MVIISSAGMLAAAFQWPAQCGWLVFIFLLPLFYAAHQRSLSFADGCMWGIIFFSLHWWGLFLVVHEHGSGTWRYAAPVFLTVYAALYAGLWFLLLNRLIRTAGFFFSCVISTFLYFVVVYRCIFWIFSCCRGYCFALPLLPLAYEPRWLYALPWISSYGLLALLIIFSATVAHFLHTRNLKFLGLAAMSCVPFVVGWVVQEVERVPSYVQSLTYAQPPHKREHPIDCAQAIDNAIQTALAKKPRAKIILMPESSYPFPLNENEQALAMWDTNALAGGQTLIIGTHCAQAGNLHNCISCVNNRRIIQNYVKSNLFWFTEYVPFPWCNFNFFQKLFLKNKKGFSSTENCCAQFHILPNLTCTCAICSEFFFRSYSPGSLPLLVVVNDAWFSAAYLQNLMFLCARYAALEEQREIIYIGHTKGVWLGGRAGVADL